MSTKLILVGVTLAAEGLGGWMGYSKYELNQLAALRQEGAIVIIRDGAPNLLQSLGIEQLSAFYAVPTVELYVTPLGSDALLGNSDKPTPKADAKFQILAQAAEARSHGAEDIQLIIIGDFDDEWMAFAERHSMSVIGETKERYKARLAANQESGANINP